VLGGVFPFVDTHGIPLEIIVDQVSQKGDVIDWLGFWNDAMKVGWKPGPTRTKIVNCVGECLGPKVSEQVKKTFDFLVKFEETDNDDEKLELLRERRETTTRTTQKSACET
jgi:hypothetical protein